MPRKRCLGMKVSALPFGSLSGLVLGYAQWTAQTPVSPCQCLPPPHLTSLWTQHFLS